MNAIIYATACLTALLVTLGFGRLTMKLIDKGRPDIAVLLGVFLVPAVLAVFGFGVELAG